MVFIDIPFAVENNRIDRAYVKNELDALDIRADAKKDAFEAIYHRNPRGVTFDPKDLAQALTLEKTLSRLGVPYRHSEESE
jgi:hypothetical protein